MIRVEEFIDYFPFSKIRECQTKAIEFVLNSFITKNKKYVILEAGTGVGKSAIAVTVSRYLQKHYKLNSYQNCSYFITTQKILQKQYMNEPYFRSNFTVNTKFCLLV